MSEKIFKRGGELIELPSHNNNTVKTEMQTRTRKKTQNKNRKAQREELRLKFACRCAYCGCELKEKGWHADHVEPVRRDFDIVRAPQGSRVSHVARSDGRVFHPDRHDLDNLFPACSACNLQSDIFNRRVQGTDCHQPERAQAYSSISAQPQRFGLVTVIEKPVVFSLQAYDASKEAEPQLLLFFGTPGGLSGLRFAVCFSWTDVGFFNPFLSLHSGIDTYSTIVIIKSNLTFEITKICRVLCSL
ncbi:HNH endonuclease [Klebsiella pneumoniae]